MRLPMAVTNAIKEIENLGDPYLCTHTPSHVTSLGQNVQKNLCSWETAENFRGVKHVLFESSDVIYDWISYGFGNCAGKYNLPFCILLQYEQFSARTALSWF